MTTTIGRWRTSQERRDSATERVSAVSAVLDTFDVHFAAPAGPSAGTVDPSALRRVVRVLLPLALDDPTFDVTVTLGSTGSGVRLHHAPGVGPTVELVESVTRAPQVHPDRSTAPEPAPGVVSELADLLRRGAVRPR